MNSLGQVNRFEEMPDFGMEAFGMSEDFDINAAFQEAIQGIASNTELALEEKVRRMEGIVSEGNSQVYREFLDFRQIAAQIESMCSHDHALSQSMQSNETLSGFMDRYKTDDGHNHTESLRSKYNQKKDTDEYEIDPKTGKKSKKKKRYGWLSLLLR